MLLVVDCSIWDLPWAVQLWAVCNLFLEVHVVIGCGWWCIFVAFCCVLKLPMVFDIDFVAFCSVPDSLLLVVFVVIIGTWWFP